MRLIFVAEMRFVPILTCQDCGANWSVTDEVHADLVAHNEVTQKLVQGRMQAWDGTDMPTSHTVNLAVCESCQRIARASTHKARHRLSVEQETAAIHRLMVEIREKRSDLSEEQIAHAAVEQWNEPWNEPDSRFAKYLKDREEKW